MNINKINANKSNLRIAPNTNLSHQHSPLVTIDLSGPITSPTNYNNNRNVRNNNNNNNNNDRNNNINPLYNHQNINTPPITSSSPNNTAKFASTHSSPSLEDTSNTISVATQNVRGINNITKFDGIMDDFFQKDISIFGLTETMLTSQSGEIMFKNYITTWNTSFTHRAYWDYNPFDRNSGVGIVLKSFVAKYVQKITRHQGRYIAVDLFLPARKLRIINIYNHQKNDWFDHSRTRADGPGKKLASFVIDQIRQAETSGFVVIIMGDFNVSPSTYMELLSNGRNPEAYYGLIKFLLDNNYIDQHPKDNNYKEYATFYFQNIPTSRIDLIWYSDSLIRNDFCFDQTWRLPSSINPSGNFHSLDHMCPIVYFTKHLFLNDLPLHRRK